MNQNFNNLQSVLFNFHFLMWISKWFVKLWFYFQKVMCPTNENIIWAEVVRVKIYNTDFHSVPKFDFNMRPFTTAASMQNFALESLAKFQKNMDILQKYSKEVIETGAAIGLRVEFELELKNFPSSPEDFW